MANTLSKKERLKSRKIIECLFADGASFGIYPLRVVWLTLDADKQESPICFTVSVSKKRFRRAVDRNRIKRLIKEAYRLQNEQLKAVVATAPKNMALMVIYTGKEIPDFKLVEKAMKKLLSKLGNIFDRC